MLGQFIPIHYHYQMLDQEPRIGGFEAAIQAVVKPGMKVVELGGGTGVLSFFAARAGASKVYCVERIPHVARAARRFLHTNGVSNRVEVINADASEYLPPTRVDVVVCEMLHTAMLREKQLAVIASFKKRYLERFGGPLPLFIPEAAVMAMQPVTTNYDFHGYQAAVPMFIDGSGNGRRFEGMAAPALYAAFQYSEDFPTHFEIDHCAEITETGTVNALRFMTKNLLTILEAEGRSIDWDMHDLLVPLSTPVAVKAGDVVRIRFRYSAGDSLLALQESIDGDDSDG
ncbi:MAG: 50S ribosomal protein L11 methyltransferase [Deltaproteobacteria bacterium]|nr:50S ribosomal protein L11 methyltransferase [Deltaproteobacteria bacterium]